MLASASLALAVAGVVLPGLPATPFLLLAAWAAARGSPELAARIETHPASGRCSQLARPARRAAARQAPGLPVDGVEPCHPLGVRRSGAGARRRRRDPRLCGDLPRDAPVPLTGARTRPRAACGAGGSLRRLDVAPGGVLALELLEFGLQRVARRREARQENVERRHHEERQEVPSVVPAAITAPTVVRASAPAPDSRSSGTAPMMVASVVIRIGRSRWPAASTAASNGSAPSSRSCWRTPREGSRSWRRGDQEQHRDLAVDVERLPHRPEDQDAAGERGRGRHQDHERMDEALELAGEQR